MKKAVALRYQRQKDSAPKVLAKGKGKIAQKIIEIAQKNGVYIQKDPDLVEILSHIQIEQEIPQKLYAVVAKILTHIYRLKKGKLKKP